MIDSFTHSFIHPPNNDALYPLTIGVFVILGFREGDWLWPDPLRSRWYGQKLDPRASLTPIPRLILFFMLCWSLSSMFRLSTEHLA